MERAQTIEKLKERLRRARQRRDEASERFEEALKTPSGIPYPDNILRIQQASRNYTSALEEVQAALDAVDDYLVHGIVLDDELPPMKSM